MVWWAQELCKVDGEVEVVCRRTRNGRMRYEGGLGDPAGTDRALSTLAAAACVKSFHEEIQRRTIEAKTRNSASAFGTGRWSRLSVNTYCRLITGPQYVARRLVVSMVLVGLLMLLALPSEVMAQSATSWEDLMRAGRLQSGDSVLVYGPELQPIDATIVNLLTDSVTVQVGGASRNLAAADVSAIERRDRISDGALVGGAIVVSAWTAMRYTYFRRDEESFSYATLYYGYPAVGAGILTGLLVDYAIKETVFDRGRVRVTPGLLNGSLFSAQLSMEW